MSYIPHRGQVGPKSHSLGAYRICGPQLWQWQKGQVRFNLIEN